MASTRKRFTKDGRPYYEIIVSRGRGMSQLTERWYPPHGWSQRAIDRELTRQAAEFERKVKSGQVISRKDARTLEQEKAAEAAKIKTLRQYAAAVYMPSLAVRCAENTRNSYQGNLDKWILPVLGDVKITQITSAQITALLLSMQAQGKSHGTCVKIYTILHGLFKMAYMTDTIDRNPMDKVQRPRPRKDEAISQAPQAYTAQEIRGILDCLDQEPLKWRALVWLLIDTGMRRGECCALQWSDVDFSQNTVTIRGNLCYTPQKGVYMDTPKNGKTRRIDVDPDVMDMLKRLRLEQSQGCISAFVFSQDGSPAPMHPQSPTRYLRTLSKRYNIPALHPHKLRHSFASIAITNGADVASVSEKLGHTDKAVTLRMYTHADQDSIKKASRIFRDAVKNQDRNQDSDQKTAQNSLL